MAYAIVAHTAVGSSAGNTVTTSGINTTGADTIFVAVSDYAAGGGTTLSDSNGNTWHGLTTHAAAVARIRIYYATNHDGGFTVGAGHTFTGTGTGAFMSLAVLATGSGLTSADPFDVQNGNTADGTPTTLQAGSVTPSVDNEIVISAIAGSGPNTFAIDSGFTITDSIAFANGAHEGVSLAYLIQTTATAENPTWTVDTGNSDAATSATFQAAAGGGGGTPGETDTVFRGFIC